MNIEELQKELSDKLKKYEKDNEFKESLDKYKFFC